MQSALMRSGFLSGLACAMLVTRDSAGDETLSLDLVEEGFEIVSAGASVEALHRLRAEWIDAVVFDGSVPRDTLRALCRAIRKDPLTWSVPIIVVGDLMPADAMVAALSAGADEIVARPVHRTVLAARIKAVIRRRAATECGCENDRGREQTNVLRCGEVVIRPDRYEVFADGLPIKLTLGEFRLLRMFVSQPERILTRDQIVRVMHGPMGEVTDRSVDSRVSALRKKLGPAGEQIQTVRGLGYRMTPHPTPGEPN